MPIQIASRRRSAASLAKAFPAAHLIDVTSRAEEPWVRLSPFYPHGGIPVPETPGVTGQSVEGIWQALKVFETEDVDPARLRITTMTGLKRTVRKHGPVLGHRDGLHGERLLPYESARRRIYLPAYRWVLEHEVADLVERLRELAAEEDVVLLDYTTNGDVTDLTTPLSHAALIRLQALNEWPACPVNWPGE
ncbi:hypothetical protein SAMN05444920_104509 [Nonomuraea solani]|uniref:Uncharacterized protein n=1 Tax=Nonomuraea solani TaxID=1144553 RepID=A0A1H6CX54_9ACTN|nr:hypothetical protein [Nonomuraea solani]SEG77610.1 hypothetical protein SAMN05444920_104509 [Nonomuraea solani]